MSSTVLVLGTYFLPHDRASVRPAVRQSVTRRNCIETAELKISRNRRHTVWRKTLAKYR